MESSQQIRTLSIVHFNDSYNIEPCQAEPIGGISRFATALKSFEKNDPLLFFSGDLFSPSNLGNVYRGKQMVEPVNALKIKASCIGNHDFDYDIVETEDLIAKTNFPWLLTNMTYPNGKQIAGTISHYIFEHNGVRIGTIGLGESEWIETLNCFTPADIAYEDFVTCGNRYAKKLKEEDKCDLVIALTHMRNPRDFSLAEKAEGIDLILGGHDHMRVIEKKNDIYVIKCAGDFREFNVIELALLPLETVKAIRKDPKKYPEYPVDKILRDKFWIDVKTVIVDSKWEPDTEVEKFVQRDLKAFEESMCMTVGFTDCPIDCRFAQIRTEGTNGSDFVADLARLAVDCDVSIINSGTLRIDSIITEGPLHLKEIFGMLPFIDPIIKLEVTGSQLLKALENGVSQYPAFEGRFPMISGVTFSFDPKKPQLERIILDSVKVGDAPLNLEQKYYLATKEFMLEGKDGYHMFENMKPINETAPGLRQELIEFFQMTAIPEFQGFFANKDTSDFSEDPSDEANVRRYQRRDSMGYKKKIEKLTKWKSFVSGVTEIDGQQYINIALKNNNRIKRLD